MLASIGPVFIQRLGTMDTEKRIVDDTERVAVAYAQAMMHAQAMEYAVRIAAPALAAPLDDEDAARAEVERGQRRRLAEAERELTAVLVTRAGQMVMPDGLEARLKAARAARNSLAHDFWLTGLIRVAGGDVDAVVEELEQAQDAFAEVLADLVDTLFATVLNARGIDERSMKQFIVALLSAASAGALSGLDLIDDVDEVVARVAALNQK